MLYKETERSRFIQREIFGPEFEGVSLGDVAPPRGREEEFTKWLSDPKHILLLMGDFGIGKTTLCAALVPWALPTFRGCCRFWTENILLTRIRNCIAEGTGDYLGELKEILNETFVIYDDLGSAGVNPWRREIISELVDNRWASEKPTIITTNLTASQLEENYSGRTFSRLMDSRNLIIEDRISTDRRINRNV